MHKQTMLSASDGAGDIRPIEGNPLPPLPFGRQPKPRKERKKAARKGGGRMWKKVDSDMDEEEEEVLIDATQREDEDKDDDKHEFRSEKKAEDKPEAQDESGDEAEVEVESEVEDKGGDETTKEAELALTSPVVGDEETNKVPKTILLEELEVNDDEDEIYDTIQVKIRTRPTTSTMSPKSREKSKPNNKDISAKNPSKTQFLLPSLAPESLITPAFNHPLKRPCRSSLEPPVESIPKRRSIARTASTQRNLVRHPISPTFLEAVSAVKMQNSPQRKRRITVPQTGNRGGEVPRAGSISITPPLPDSKDGSDSNLVSEPEPEIEPEQVPDMESGPDMQSGPDVESGLDMEWEPEMNREPQWNPSKGKGKQVLLNSPTPSPRPVIGMETSSPVMKDTHVTEFIPIGIKEGLGLESDPGDLASSSPPPPRSSLPPSASAASAPTRTPPDPPNAPSSRALRSYTSRFAPYKFPRSDPYATLSARHKASINRWKDPSRAKFNRWTGPRIYTSLTQNQVIGGCGLVLMSSQLHEEHEAHERWEIEEEEEEQRRAKEKRKPKQFSPEL